jgi:hypothetical protein
MSSQLEREGIKKGIWYEGPNPKAFRTLMVALNDIVTEVTLHFREDGIHIVEYPKGASVIINVHIDATKLEHSYEIRNGIEFTLPFDTNQLLKNVSALHNERPFNLIYDYDDIKTPCIRIRSVDPSGGSAGTGKATVLNQRDAPEMDLELPQLLKVQLPSAEFLRVINIMSQFSGHRGKMILALSIGGDDTDYIELTALEETDSSSTWTERLFAQVTNLASDNNGLITEPVGLETIDCDADPTDEASFAIISRAEDMRPAKRRRFERFDNGREAIELTKKYSTTYLKTIAKIVNMVQSVDLVFLQQGDAIIWCVQMDIPDFGHIKFLLAEQELDD